MQSSCIKKHSVRLIGYVFVAMALGALHGCTVPDLDHAKQRLHTGEFSSAHSELELLANRGVVEAMVLLADQLSRSEPMRAESYYLRAVDAGDFKARGRLAKLYSQLAADAQQSAKLMGLATAGVPGIEDAGRALDFSRKALALGDDSVLSTIVRLNELFPELNVHDEAAEIIRVSQHSVSTNALYAQVLWWESQGQSEAHAAEVERICNRLGYLEVGCYRSLISLYQLQNNEIKIESVIERVKKMYRANHISGSEIVSLANWLKEKDPASKGAFFALSILDITREKYPEANYEIVRLLYQNPNLQYSADLNDLLLMQQKTGDWRSSEMLGEMYFIGKQRPLDPEKACGLLEPIKNKSVNANYYLGLLARDGLLGAPDAKSALNYLLMAARFGHEKADLALAEMFWSARGVAKNPVYAYSFARIAGIRGSMQAEKLSAEISGTLPQAKIDTALEISNQELDARRLIKKKHLTCCELQVQGAVAQ